MTWNAILNLQLQTEKKECKINFISNLFTFYQLKSQIPTVSLNNIQIWNFSGGICIILQIFKYLNFKIIIDMYNTCTVGRQWE